MPRNNHSQDAVPAEIVAEGSNPVGADVSSAFAVDADLTDPGDQPSVPDDVAADSADDPGAADPGAAEVVDGATLRKLLEALIFAADKPLSLQRLRQLTRIGEVAVLQQALGDLAIEYQDRGIALHEVSGGYQFRTNTAFSPWVQQLIAGRPVRLSRAQLETLAIIAYRQPITRPEIDEIRGVDSSATLRLLLDRSLVRILGKREEVGRPMLYGTTKEFLEFFSLTDLRELPTLREYSELTAESRKVVSERLGMPESAMDTVAAIETSETVATTDEVAATDEDEIEASTMVEAFSDLEATGEMDGAESTEVFASSEEDELAGTFPAGRRSEDDSIQDESIQDESIQDESSDDDSSDEP